MSKDLARLTAELNAAREEVSLLSDALEELTTKHAELEAMYKVALEDIKRLMHENARLQMGEFADLAAVLGVRPTNPAWSNVKCTKDSDGYRVWFTSRFYNANRATCVTLLRKLSTMAVAKGFKAQNRSTYLSITKPAEKQKAS